MPSKIKKTKKWWGTSKKFKGSVIVVTFFVIMLILTIALSLVLVTIKDMKGSIGASKSNLAYQSADEGVEEVMADILKKGYIKVSQIRPTGTSCGDDGLIRKGSSYIVELLDDSTPVVRIDCNSEADISTVKNIKSIGVSQVNAQKSERAIRMPVSGDPYTKLLLHMDGSGQTFIDSSPGAKTVTARGCAIQSSDQSKFGDSSVYFYCVISEVLSPDNVDFHLDGDFTIDFWAYPKNISAGVVPFYLSNLSLGISPNGHLTLAVNGALVIDEGSLETEKWYHFALSRSGTAIRLFLDGTQVGSTYNSSAVFVPIDFSPYPYNYFVIGAKPVLSNTGVRDAGNFRGYIDEFRLSKGIAHWTSNFTPPTAPY